MKTFQKFVEAASPSKKLRDAVKKAIYDATTPLTKQPYNDEAWNGYFEMVKAITQIAKQYGLTYSTGTYLPETGDTIANNGVYIRNPENEKYGIKTKRWTFNVRNDSIYINGNITGQVVPKGDGREYYDLTIVLE